MYRRRKKHHIYTFVLNKSIFGILFIVIICAVSVISYFMSDLSIIQIKSYNLTKSIFKKTLSSAQSVVKNPKREIPKRFSDGFLKQSSPVFATYSTQKPKKAAQTTISNKKEKSSVMSVSLSSENLDIKNETQYEINPFSLVNAKIESDTEKGGTVLIMHTHACEAYSGKTGVGEGDGGTFRSTNQNKNMIKIGEALKTVLEEKGIKVYHDKTLCDYPSYNSAYQKALGLIDWYVQKYPDIKFVFDIHRDAVTDSDGNPEKVIYKKDGKTYAQAMIVCGTDSMRLYHPYWKDNLILALKIQKKLEEKYPGFMRPVNLRKERFNMHKTKGSLIMEIGSHGNTQEEALASVKLLGEGISEVLK